MKNLKWILSGLVAIGFFVTVLESCSTSDSGPTSIALSSLTAGTIDLNGAVGATTVPVDAEITATFSTEVDASTITTANITLTQDYDSKAIELEVSAAGKTVTIAPKSVLSSGALYKLKFTNAIKSANGKLLPAGERNFTTIGTFSPSSVIAHWNFENSDADVVGNFDPTNGGTDITYVDSRNTAAGKAASFNGTTSIIEVPGADGLMSHTDFALSFWVKPTYTEGKGAFVLGLAGWYGFQFEIPDDWTWVKLATRYDLGDGTTDSEDAFFPGNGQTKDNGGWQGWTYQKDVSASGGVGDTYFKDKWAHVVVTYKASTKINTMYINGEKVKEHDFNLWPSDAKKKNVTGVKYAGNAAPGNKLAFGFIQSSENKIIGDDWADPSVTTNKHFKGLLDDVRVFSSALTATEVSLMYNSEKP